MNDFIKQQQELARRHMTWGGQFNDLKATHSLSPEAMDRLDTLITQIIQNTGEELLRFVNEMQTTSADTIAGQPLLDKDTIKQHITNLTGAE